MVDFCGSNLSGSCLLIAQETCWYRPWDHLRQPISSQLHSIFQPESFHMYSVKFGIYPTFAVWKQSPQLGPIPQVKSSSLGWQAVKLIRLTMIRKLLVPIIHKSQKPNFQLLQHDSNMFIVAICFLISHGQPTLAPQTSTIPNFYTIFLGMKIHKFEIFS